MGWAGLFELLPFRFLAGLLSFDIHERQSARVRLEQFNISASLPSCAASRTVLRSSATCICMVLCLAIMHAVGSMEDACCWMHADGCMGACCWMHGCMRPTGCKLKQCAVHHLDQSLLRAVKRPSSAAILHHLPLSARHAFRHAFHSWLSSVSAQEAWQGVALAVPDRQQHNAESY